MSPQEFAARFSERYPPLDAQAAAIEASRCLNCFDAPCMAACPTHIDVPGFIKKIASGNLRGSARAILDSNILGLSCSRVCPVEVLCEGACVMHRFHRSPIRIGLLQRHAMDYFYGHSPSIETGAENGKRVACIGAGPASLACAADLRRKGFAATVFDRQKMAGGLNTYGIAEYKLRPADSLREVELIESMGVEFRLGREVGANIEELEREFDAIFLGVGLGPTRRLGVEGEHLAGVIDALRFIADYKTGSPWPARNAVVVGGGNTAIDAANAARRLGAESVSVVYRRGQEEMSAFDDEYDRARLEGIDFVWWTRIRKILGTERVEAIECERGDGSAYTIECDAVIPAIGQSRLVDFLARCRGVAVERGCVAVDRATGQTANPKYFAGGDCVNGGREVVDAVADGKRAAAGIAKWLI